jgi:hypothetical protein
MIFLQLQHHSTWILFSFCSTDHKRVIHQVYNSVPFTLHASQTSVEVLDAHRTDILDLEITENHFEPSHPSGLELVWGFFTGE